MLENYISDIYACSRCGDCRESVKLEPAHKGVYKVCPIKNQLGFGSYTARVVLLYEIETQFFTVEQTRKGTEITKGEHDKPDIVIRITPEGVQNLISCKTKEEYLAMYKHLYKETDHLDFEVKTNMFTAARKGYVSWAKKAGLLSI